METVIYQNTKQTISLFNNLNIEEKYEFFRQIEEEIEEYYMKYIILSEEKKKELDKRSYDIDSGKVKTISWNLVQEEIKEKYGF